MLKERDRSLSEDPIEYPPVFVWPPKPVPFLRWFAGYPGYLLPFNVLYVVLSVVVWTYATPSVATMSTWSAGWVLLVLLRNAVLLVAWYSALSRLAVRAPHAGHAVEVQLEVARSG